MSVLPTISGGSQVPPGALLEWLRTHAPHLDVSHASGLRPASLTAGWSNRTWLVDLETGTGAGTRPEPLVVRAGPADPVRAYFPDDSIARQYAVLDTLGRATALPVPPVLFYDETGGPLGAECYVMRRIDGDVPADAPPFLVQGFVAEATDAQRGDLWEATVRAVADVGRVTRDQVAGLPSARPAAGTGRSAHVELNRWIDYYRWASANHDEVDLEIEAVVDWLTRHVPDRLGDRLVWGDARFANIVYRDFDVQGLLDWELADVGDPTNDIAYFLVLQRMAEAGMGARRHVRPRPGGFWTEAHTVEWHAELTGTPPRELRYYWVLNIFKLVAMMQRMAWLLETSGLSSPDSARRRRRSPQLLAWARTAMERERFLDVAEP